MASVDAGTGCEPTPAHEEARVQFGQAPVPAPHWQLAAQAPQAWVAE